MRYRSWRAHLGAVLICFVLGACATQSVPMVPSNRTFTARDYEDVYARWTRDVASFSFQSMREQLHASATFEGWEFRWAYVVRYANDFALDTDARAAMLRATLQDATEHHRFFVTVAAERFRDSDLVGDAAGWRVLLVDAEGRSIPPSSIEEIDRPTPAERQYFMSITNYRKIFRVTFPVEYPDGSPTIPTEGPSFVLRFTGPQGSVDLQWDTR
jgi:hypothetical protein